METNLNSSGTVKAVNNLNSYTLNPIGGYTTITNIVSPYYDKGEIVDTLIFEDRIEVIYKAKLIQTVTYTFTLSSYNNQPQIKVYKEIYSRTDGTMQKVDGTYIPEQHIEEDYQFDSDL
jgi:hypothetical protein